MIEGGYRPSTANRDTSQIGTVYRWAITKKLPPKNFISPTRAMARFEEGIRHVEIAPEEITKLLAGAHSNPDRRFAVYVRLLHETGARKGEIVERIWKDIDLDKRQITVMTTKTGKPRTLFFSSRPPTSCAASGRTGTRLPCCSKAASVVPRSTTAPRGKT